MDRYSFMKVTPEGREISLRFKVSADITLEEFVYMCKKFAYALGYAAADVEEYFEDDEPPF